MKVTVLPCKRSQILFPMPQKILKEKIKKTSLPPKLETNLQLLLKS